MWRLVLNWLSHCESRIAWESAYHNNFVEVPDTWIFLLFLSLSARLKVYIKKWLSIIFGAVLQFSTQSHVPYISHKMSQVSGACKEVSRRSNDSSVGHKLCSQEGQPAGSVWGLSEACWTLYRARRLGLMTKGKPGGGRGGTGKNSLPFLQVGEKTSYLLNACSMLTLCWEIFL